MQDSTFRKVLTSVDRNLSTPEWKISSREITPENPSSWSIRTTTLHGGKQEGSTLVTIDNGWLEFSVIPTRGMGLLEARRKDLRLGWDSPVGEVVHPAHIRLESRGGLGWLEGFNEWVVRCGLESAGAPGRDEFRTNTGETAKMDLTLHGRIANTPASDVSLEVDREPPYEIRLRGTVRESSLFGPHLELRTTTSTIPGSSSIRVRDQVTNRGSSEQEFQLLYHANYGPPLLEKGARFRAPIREIFPINERAAEDLETFDRYEGPTAGFVEQVYCMELAGDDEGRARVLLHNASGDHGVTMSFSVEELPYFSLWKNTASLTDGYVTGLEPATGFPYPRRHEREAGRVPSLGPGETRTFEIEYTLLETEEEVTKAADQILTVG